MDVEGDNINIHDRVELANLEPDYSYLDKVYFSVDKDQFQEVKNALLLYDRAKKFKGKVKRKKRFKIDLFRFRIQIETVRKNSVSI